MFYSLVSFNRNVLIHSFIHHHPEESQLETEAVVIILLSD